MPFPSPPLCPKNYNDRFNLSNTPIHQHRFNLTETKAKRDGNPSRQKINDAFGYAKRKKIAYDAFEKWDCAQKCIRSTAIPISLYFFLQISRVNSFWLIKSSEESETGRAEIFNQSLDRIETIRMYETLFSSNGFYFQIMAFIFK